MRKTVVVLMMFTLGLTLMWAGGESESTSNSGEEKEVVTLRIPVWPDNAPEVEMYLEAFQEEYGKINIDYWQTDPKEYRAQIFVQLAGGSDIDIVWTQNNAVYSELAGKGMLYPINELIERDNFDVSFLGPLYDATEIEGVSYGLPGGTSSWPLFYNKDLFDAAGVAYPTDDMTWQEFREKAMALSSGSGENKTWGAYLHSWPAIWFGPANQTGATVVDEDLTPYQEAMEFRKALEDDGSIMPYFDQIASNTHYTNVFYKGNVGMVPIGNWFVGMLWEKQEAGEIDFNWDIAAMPTPDGVSPYTSWGMAAPIAINSKSKNVEAAWEFIKWRLKSPKASLITASVGNIPSFVTDEAMDEFEKNLQKYGQPENLTVILKQKIYPEYPAVPDINYIVNTIYKEESELYFAGEQSSRQAIQKIKKRIQDEVVNQ